MSRKNIWTFVVFFATFVLVSNYPVDVPCEQCGGKCIEECLMARVACNFQRNFYTLNVCLNIALITQFV